MAAEKVTKQVTQKGQKDIFGLTQLDMESITINQGNNYQNEKCQIIN